MPPNDSPQHFPRCHARGKPCHCARLESLTHSAQSTADHGNACCWTNARLCALVVVCPQTLQAGRALSENVKEFFTCKRISM
jgi:hypothetical protein